MTGLKQLGVPTPNPAQPSGGVAIEVRDLRMRYGETDVLVGVDFTARRGEVVALLGPNGDERWRARLGIVLQSWRDHAKWQVRELLDYIGSYYPCYSDDRITRPWRTDELIELVGLTEHARKRVGRLSGGQRRRLDVAIGIVGRPEVLFLDEPTAGFDPEARRDFHDLVHRLVDADETTILLTTHDLDEADKLADRILILGGGRVIANGSPDALALRMSSEAEVRWSRDGQRFVHGTTDATRFVRELFAQYGTGIADPEVRRATLEDTYMALVREFEAGRSAEAAVREFREVPA